jgi:hypothetical protein
MFLLFDRVEHECRNRFAGESETHFRSSAFPTSIGRVIFLSETWRPRDRPVETAGLHDFFHRTRITHVVSQDEADNAIGNTGKMGGSRKNQQPLYAGTVHCPRGRNCTVVEEVSSV